MSGKAVGWAMEQRTGNPTTKLVLLKLADNANEWVAWPSMKLMCDDTELGESTVRKHLRILEGLGLITGRQRFHEGVQLTTAYTLNAEGWVPRHEVKRAERAEKSRGPAGGPPVQQVEARGQPMSDPGPAGGPTPPHGVAPNPYVEPLEEPALTRARVWPAFQKWPGRLPSSANETRTLAALDRLKDPPSLGELIACIDAQGVEYERSNAARREQRQGDEPLVAPHNWLERDRGFEKYLPVVRERPSVIAAGVERAARVMATLGAEVHARLRRARLTEGEISELDGATFLADPIPTFANLTPRQEQLLRRHHQDLHDIWPGVRFEQAASRRQA